MPDPTPELLHQFSQLEVVEAVAATAEFCDVKIPDGMLEEIQSLYMVWDTMTHSDRSNWLAGLIVGCRIASGNNLGVEDHLDGIIDDAIGPS